jgi:hypothetical protein
VDPAPISPGRCWPSCSSIWRQAPQALAEFEASQKVDPNRFHGLAGAARAGDRAGARARARKFHEQLVDLARTGDTELPELIQARAFLKN